MSTAAIPKNRIIAVPDSFADAKVLIWGIGIHGGGLAAARWCAAEGARISVLDRHCPADLTESASLCAAAGWHWHVGETRHPICRSVDYIVASPAIPPAVIAALPGDAAPVIGADSIFFARHRGPRVAVSGTKGKSTTAHMCGRLLDWPVGGNSHRPLLDLLRERGTRASMVCELSSFQLWYLRHQAPRFDQAVISSLGQDHLDWHRDLDHYHKCKQSLVDWAEVCFAQADTRERFPACKPPAVNHDEDYFRLLDGTPLCPRDHLSLRGRHNAANAELALTVALEQRLDPPIAAIRLATVDGLPHRLERVREAGSLQFVNDSVATTPEATVAGLEAIDGPQVVILGGRDKGSDFAPLARALREEQRRAICLAGSPQSLYASLEQAGITVSHVEDLRSAVDQAVGLLGQTGGTVLLSPACASAPPFRDFADRGEAFRHIVTGLQLEQPTAPSAAELA